MENGQTYLTFFIIIRESAKIYYLAACTLKITRETLLSIYETLLQSP